MSTEPTPRGTGTEPRTRSREGSKVDRKFEAKTLAALGVAALLVVFAVVNSQSVEVDFLVFQSDTPLVVALVIATLLGFVLGNLTRRRSHRARR